MGQPMLVLPQFADADVVAVALVPAGNATVSIIAIVAFGGRRRGLLASGIDIQTAVTFPPGTAGQAAEFTDDLSSGTAFLTDSFPNAAVQDISSESVVPPPSPPPRWEAHRLANLLLSSTH